MASEELRVKVVVDTTDLKQSVNKAKREISGVTGDVKGTGKATDATAESMKRLADSMAQIKGMNAIDFVQKAMERLKSNTQDVNKNFQTFRSNIKNAGKEIGRAFSPKNYDVGEDGLKGYLESITIDTKEAMTSLKNATKNVGAAFKSMGQTAVAALGTTMAKAAALLAVLMSIVALIRNGIGVSQLGKSMNVLAQQAGMSADAYQRWAFVLTQIGLQVDDMIGAQQTLLEAQMDVREGTEDIVEAFKRIGLTQEQVLSMNQQQLFERTVEGLQGLENATERASVAYKLLSEDSKNLAPLLNLNSEQVAQLAYNFDTLNGAMSEGLIKSSNRLQASLGNMRAAWQGLKNTLAELVLPIIIDVVNWLTKAIATINFFVRTVFGLDIGGSATKGMETAAENTSSYKESVDKATKSAEKLKRTLMGFDELNVVSNPNISSSGSDDAYSGLSGNYAGGVTDSLFGADAIDLGPLREKFAEYKTMIQDITTWGLIGVGTGVAVLGALSGNIPLVVAGLSLAGIGFAAGNVDDGTFDRLRQKFEELNLGLVPIAIVGIGAVGAVVSLLTGNIPLAITFAALAGIGLSLGGGEDLKNYVTTYEKEIQKVVAPSMIAVGAVVAPLALMMGNIPLAIAGLALVGGGLALGGIASGGLKAFVDEFGKNINMAVNIAVGAVSVIGLIICLFTGNIPGAIAFGALAGVSLYNIGKDTGFFKKCGEAIQKAWDDIKKWFNEKVKPVFTKDYWNKKFEPIRVSAGEKMDQVKTAFVMGWSKVTTWFNQSVKPKFTKQYWADKFSSIKDGAKAAFNGVIDIVERAINNIVNKANTLSWKIPDWVPKVGGEKFGFNVKTVSIPRLATGGITTGTTMAMIGERGKEAVLPLENNTGWMDMLADRLASRMNPATKVVLKVDERELGYATIHAINQNTKQTGGLQLQLV